MSWRTIPAVFVRAVVAVRLGSEEVGASAVEYALLVAFIAGVVIFVLGALGINVLGLFSKVPDF